MCGFSPCSRTRVSPNRKKRTDAIQKSVEIENRLIFFVVILKMRLVLSAILLYNVR